MGNQALQPYWTQAGQTSVRSLGKACHLCSGPVITCPCPLLIKAWQKQSLVGVWQSSRSLCPRSSSKGPLSRQGVSDGILPIPCPLRDIELLFSHKPIPLSPSTDWLTDLPEVEHVIQRPTLAASSKHITNSPFLEPEGQTRVIKWTCRNQPPPYTGSYPALHQNFMQHL